MNACEIIVGNCLDVLPAIKTDMRKVIVTDPPFNIGYHYKGYSDRVGDYMGLLAKALSFADAFVVVHYPEALHELSIKLGKAPDRVVSWVYNSNTRRQHRDIAFYGIKPDFSLVRQPYKNPKDKRIAERIARGITGGASYDWIEANQVKNVTKGRGGINHPCVMPLKVMEMVIGIIPNDGNTLIIDPFCGTGTTLAAALGKGFDCIGIDIIPEYAEEARRRVGIIDDRANQHF